MTSRLRLTLISALAGLPALALSGELVTAAPVDDRGAVAVDRLALAVDWPPSAGLLLSEVMTGGASASDEFFELYNAGPLPADLAGLELAYVSATGGTVTRKAGWTTSQAVQPGQHVLLANVLGVFAGAADATYSGGLAASGGSLVLRANTDGTVLDALGWGTAANAFVEGLPAPAAAPGASVERSPGMDQGNGTDTNDNSTDWFLQAAPNPQGLADAPIVPPSAPPSQPLPSEPLPPETSPSEPPVPPSPEPSASLPIEPVATPTPTPVATPAPTDAASPIAAVRLFADGTLAAIEGVLTTPLGLTEGGQGAFVQDPTAGIALYLGPGPWPALPAGILVRVTGTTDTRYGQATLRIAGPDDLIGLGPASQPAALTSATGSAGEALEGLLVRVEGRIVSGPEALSDGFAVDVDDGSGALRVVAALASGIGAADLPRGASVALVGVLGQRDSSGTGSAGYRLNLRDAGDVSHLPPASPTPGGSGSVAPGATPGASDPPTASPGPSGSAEPSVSQGPSASPAPSSGPQVVPIAGILGTVGVRVGVAGSVTSPASTWGVDGRRITIQDASGAILVRLPAGVRAPAVGQRIEVLGKVGHYLGAAQLGAEAPPARLGSGPPLAPRPVAHGPLGPGWTWRLAVAAGRVLEIRHSPTSWRAELRLSDGSRVPVGGGLATAAASRRVEVGALVAVTGIVRPPASGAADRRSYVVARGAADVVILHAAAPASAGGSGSGRGSGAAGGAGAALGTGSSADVLEADLSELSSLAGRVVRVSGIVVALGAGSLTLDDGTAEANVRLTPDAEDLAASLELGTALSLVGRVERAADGTWEIALRSAADLSLLGDPGGSGGLASPGSPEPGTSGTLAAALLAEPREANGRVAVADPIAYGLALAGGLALVALAGTLGWRWRRRSAERAFEARLRKRLESLSATPAGLPPVRP